jgi:hypothetical protein
VKYRAIEIEILSLGQVPGSHELAPLTPATLTVLDVYCLWVNLGM